MIGTILFYLGSNKSKTASGPHEEVSGLTAKVGELMDLPNNEEPMVATVSDVTKLANQPFFAKALNGDKVLAYTKNKKAILYRPSTNKIIEVTFYEPQGEQISSESAQPQPTSSQSKKVKVFIFNGTQKAGLAKTRGTELSNKLKNLEISGTGNAKGNFEESIVIDLSKSNKDLSNQIASELKGKVGNMPSGEEQPDGVDILVILGSSE
jgi:hypothetical protein